MVLDIPSFPQGGGESSVSSLASCTPTAPGLREANDVGLAYVGRWSPRVGEEWMWVTAEEGLGQQKWSHVCTHRTSGVRLRPMVSQEAQLDQGHDLYWAHLGDLRAMQMSVGHQPEFGILIQAWPTNPKMVSLSRGKNCKRLRGPITPHHLRGAQFTSSVQSSKSDPRAISH